MRSLWIQVTKRARANGYREGFGSGLAWGALLCLTVAVLTLHVSLWWYSRSPVQQEYRGKARTMICAVTKGE